MAGKRTHRRKLTKRQLSSKYKEVRRQLRSLQKKGLVSKQANLSKPKPSYSLRRKAADMRRVLEGSATGVYVPKNIQHAYKEAGFKIVNGQIIIEHDVGEKPVYEPKYKNIVIKHPRGKPRYIMEVKLPINMDFQSFYDRLTSDYKWLENMAPKGAIFGFTYFGARSLEAGDAQWLSEYIVHYSTFYDPSWDKEAWQNLVIYAFDRDQDWEARDNKKNFYGHHVGKADDKGNPIKRGRKRRLTKRSKPIRHANSQRKYVDKLLKADPMGFKLARAAKQKDYRDRKRLATNATKINKDTRT